MKQITSKNTALILLSLLLISLFYLNFVSAIDCTNSLNSTNNQYWTANKDVSLEITYLGKSSSLTHSFGYYLNGNSPSWLFNDANAAIGSKYSVNLPKNTKIGFVIDKASLWYTETKLNSDNNFNHFSFSGLSNNFNLAAEDLAYGGDRDFNDILVNIRAINCAICSNNSDCNDNNLRTEDICVNPGTFQSSCSHNNIRCLSNSDCGTDAFTGSNFCQGNGIFQNYNSFTCLNPGTAQSSCSNSVTAMLKVSCNAGQICTNASCITTQCSNNIDDDLDGLKDSQDPGCWDNINDAGTYNPLLNNEGRASISCFSNAQCGRDGFIGGKYCQNGSVYQDYKSFTCSNPGVGSSSCNTNTVQRNLQTCANGCSNGECLISVCSSNSDCNDNDVYTVDVCNNPGTSQSSCSHTKVNCVNDNDCGMTGFYGAEFCSSNDVFKNFKTSRCINPGTVQSNCQVTDIAKLLLDCGENSCESYGNNYCKNNNVYHQRTCNDKGCSNGACSSTFRAEENLVQTCANGCVNGQCKPECTASSDCTNGKVCQNNLCVQVSCNSNVDCNDNNPNTQDVCNNPGTASSSCSHNNIFCSLDSDCGASRFLNQPTCSNGNVFDNFLIFSCNNPGTGSSYCVNHTESRQKNNCANGCLDGSCIGAQCSSDSDCPNDYVSPTKTCNGDNVFELFHDYSCVNSQCIDNSISRLFDSCDYKCRSGKCIENSSGVSGLDEESIETSPLILTNKVVDKPGVQIIATSSSEGINETSLKLGKNYVIESGEYDYLWFIIFGFIVLLVIIIVVIAILLSRN